jgi:hypothetical protein
MNIRARTPNRLRSSNVTRQTRRGKVPKIRGTRKRHNAERNRERSEISAHSNRKIGEQLVRWQKVYQELVISEVKGRPAGHSLSLHVT